MMKTQQVVQYYNCAQGSQALMSPTKHSKLKFHSVQRSAGGSCESFKQTSSKASSLAKTSSQRSFVQTTANTVLKPLNQNQNTEKTPILVKSLYNSPVKVPKGMRKSNSEAGVKQRTESVGSQNQ